MMRGGGIPVMTTKQLVQRVVKDLPDDATIEDVIERLYFLHNLQRSIAQADAGETIPHEDVMRQMDEWLK
jgi:hypothetical protein